MADLTLKQIPIEEKDLWYEYNTRGYMLYYKDRPIGGAGIL